MMINKGGKIFSYQYCQTGCVSAIAQTTSITRTKTACLPDQKNILCTFSQHEKFEHRVAQNYTPNVEMPNTLISVVESKE